ncbi:MAG TPA: phospholipase D family protein [Candidatus Merdenecus merdavium]|nr:phospholipase D family protein [Candidatus Merdenecus merdavium]
MKKKIIIIVVCLVVYLLMGAMLPFIYHPKISKETEEDVQNTQFINEEVTDERAYVIVDNGEALEERIRMISQAKNNIVMSTFEMRSDESGKKVLAALYSAAVRGVHVQCILDGSTELLNMKGNEYFYALSTLENVEIRIYNPISLLRPWSIMGRLHDKYLIVDEELYILGGRNTYDYFLGDQPGYKNYDWDVLVYNQEKRERDSMNQLLSYFNNIWNLPENKVFGKDGKLRKKKSVKLATEEIKELYYDMQQQNPDWFEPMDYVEKTKPVNHIQLISNPITYYSKEPIAYYTITELMKSAKEEVVFHTPYIICNDWMLGRLTEVSDTVPKVTMLTNSVANNGNPFGAVDYLKNKPELLDTGIQILEYDGGISYHGKCFVIDHNLSAIGSFNWDMRSAYIDTELMLVIDSEEINKDLRQAMASYEEEALVVIDEENYILPEGVVPQEITKKRERRIRVLKIFGKPFRFLM